jgi:molybdate transport system regulatory protein
MPQKTYTTPVRGIVKTLTPPGRIVDPSAAVTGRANAAPTMRMHLWLETEDGLFFGIGRAQLLERIHTHGSLKKAADELGMSYRAAWGKIRKTEAVLGQKIIQRSGTRRDGHELTAFGKQLKNQFENWFTAVEKYALELAARTFDLPVNRFVEKTPFTGDRKAASSRRVVAPPR